MFFPILNVWMKVTFIYNAHDDALCKNDLTRKPEVLYGKLFHPPSISMLYTHKEQIAENIMYGEFALKCSCLIHLFTLLAYHTYT